MGFVWTDSGCIYGDRWKQLCKSFAKFMAGGFPVLVSAEKEMSMQSIAYRWNGLSRFHQEIV